LGNVYLGECFSWSGEFKGKLNANGKRVLKKFGYVLVATDRAMYI